MDTVVLKFGGSSLADNEKLHIVADKIINFKKQGKNVVTILSAQGKTTDNLIREAKELDLNPNKRELDMLMATGEQMSVAKLAILLNKLGFSAISLNAWQAKIYTNDIYGDSKIEKIDTKRILDELSEGKIVLITGFQGITKNNDIATLGRGGSDTSALAIASALDVNYCYIFSDVDGVYTADPKIIKNTKKLEQVSYEEMQEIADEGAKVLHNKCIKIAQKDNVQIEAASTFKENKGTIINDEKSLNIKSIVFNKECNKVSIIGNAINENEKIIDLIMDIIAKFELNIINIEISKNKICIKFKEQFNLNFMESLHNKLFNIY